MNFRTVLWASCLGAGCLVAWLVLSPSFVESARSAEAPVQEPAISSEAKLAAKAIQVPAGFTLKTVASEPNLANPVAFCFDPAGRIFVAETYRVGKGVEDDRHHMDWLDDDLAARTVADRREYLKRHMGDQIQKFMEASEQVRLLEDRDADGVYEFSSIFSNDYKNIEDGAAAGVMWSNNRLLFTCIPTLWELRDADGDGKAEERRSLATGFGVHTAFYGHDLHGLCEGPDGKVYFSIGDRGLNVETPNGNAFQPRLRRGPPLQSGRQPTRNLRDRACETRRSSRSTSLAICSRWITTPTPATKPGWCTSSKEWTPVGGCLFNICPIAVRSIAKRSGIRRTASSPRRSSRHLPISPMGRRDWSIIPAQDFRRSTTVVSSSSIFAAPRPRAAFANSHVEPHGATYRLNR